MYSSTRFASRLALCLAISVVVSIAWPVSTAAGASRVPEVRFTKDFTDGPVRAGDVVTLEFSIENWSATSPVVDLSFTDDLAAMLGGLEAMNLPMYDIVGPGSLLTGADFLTLTGGTLPPGATATFQIDMRVPPTTAPGSYTNTTSELFLLGEPIAPAATATLEVVTEEARLTKEFINDPVMPGDSVTLRFTLENLSPMFPVSDISFNDDLNAALAGLEAINGPMSDIAGPGSQLTGTSFLMFTGGTLPPGATAMFDIDLRVPLTAAPGNYTNTTSEVVFMGRQISPAAADTLVVIPEPASISLLLAALGPVLLRRRR